MEINTKSTRMYSIGVLLEMQKEFFKNVLDGISDEDAHNRMDTKANHIAWLAGSLVEQRYDLTNLLGGTNEKQAAHDLFKDYQGIKEDVRYPPLSTYLKDWEHISPLLAKQVSDATDEQLKKIIDMGEMKFPVFDLVSFSTYREANHIGQIALWRRLLGYEPMKYM